MSTSCTGPDQVAAAVAGAPVVARLWSLDLSLGIRSDEYGDRYVAVDE